MIREEELVELFRSHQGGRFEIKGILGSGAMGLVVRAYDTRLKVTRAIKMFNPAMLSNESLVRRFQNEASIMASIEHPNIVRVYDVGEIQRHQFMVLEWVDGGSLKSALDVSGAMHPRTALQMIYRVCDALTVAHARGIIHRDIKPDNILLTKSGIPKVADFGIAHVDEDGKNPLTGTGEGMVTPKFGAPEQYSDAASVDARSDVYATAVTFWVLMTKKVPPGLLFFHDLQSDPSLLDGIPVCIHDILEKAVAYKPDGRFSSMEAFADALRKVEHLFPAMDDRKVSSGFDVIGVMDETHAAPAGTHKPVSKPVFEPTRVAKQLARPTPDRATQAYKPSGASHPEEQTGSTFLLPEVTQEPASDTPDASKPVSNRPRGRVPALLVALVLGIGIVWFAAQSASEPEVIVKSDPLPPLVMVSPVQDVFVSVDTTLQTEDVSLSEESTETIVVQVMPDVLQRTEEDTRSPSKDSSSRKEEKPVRRPESKADASVQSVPPKIPEPKVPDPIPPKPPVVEPVLPKPEPLRVRVDLRVPSEDSVRVWLVGPGGRHKLPGSVPPGTYKVVAIFKDQEEEQTVIRAIEVQEGHTLRLRCNSEQEACFF